MWQNARKIRDFRAFPSVMAVLVTAIRVFCIETVLDGRDTAFGRPGHDDRLNT